MLSKHQKYRADPSTVAMSVLMLRGAGAARDRYHLGYHLVCGERRSNLALTVSAIGDFGISQNLDQSASVAKQTRLMSGTRQAVRERDIGP
ncbi:hypothetical protein [Bradyrhizobium sp. CB3481]|uniref:hypothetical protein n=1 Tax=Bradyrhizobium sp. CB3481 TaxID=3039158 RepID=UPI0024B1C996|nr:hypothetical protein [Bradyrhizobium sp. CB3481]WFU14816.1 hypothetical protein QA643_27695 [Bradyrhizobium sp. CB3481]